ncbi:tubulin nucleotide-binding domain-like protein [Daldinia caldariorum]|uniref:tubulin nucleotide-binding domain-like protein n=1 Tax=Daldinia caldariorum TaxID=326644 RepID=UPI002007DB78|nr:tubulin nucleotide-binding domain-like protein [Daldinia caldariorum]KAI1465014.1 tubulin nucleotide-binding domain-like protein [Daldinia caldariorum]
MREIVTLQLGQQSNYLATHFWNVQESYFTYGADEESPIDHDVHFRPGIGSDGSETFMPRTVIYDLKGGFGTLRKINALYDIDDDATSSSLWSGQTIVQRQQPIEASSYQQSLDAGQAPPKLTTSTVRYWSDFNRVFFHPKSIIQLSEYELNSTVMPFEKWHMGEELFGSLDKEHDLLDRDLRPFIEEADQMQGLQIMTGLDDAWAGFAAKYLERLRDEYGKTPIWVFGAQEPNTGLSREKRLLKLANKARALTEFNSQASLVIPLALPESPLPRSVRLDPASTWHVTALFAAAVESTTLYTRLKMSDRVYSSSLGNMADILNVFGKQTIANLEMSVSEIQSSTPNGNGTNGVNGHSDDNRIGPVRSLHGTGVALYADSEAGSEKGAATLDIDLSSPQDLNLNQGYRRRRRRRIFSQVLADRGPESSESAKNDDEAEMEDTYGVRHRPKVHNYRSSVAFPIIDSYPKIFRDSYDHPVKDRVSVRTALSTDSTVTDKVKALRSTVIRSIGLEDRETIGNELAEIADSYKEGWSSDSDDDNDEE